MKRRGCVKQSNLEFNLKEEEIVSETKPFNISKNLVVQAFKLIKANAGSAGVDHQSLADFEVNLKDNLYKIWNRMSSGTHFPPPVKAVPIPKKSGGERILGVPTVADRIAQMVVKLTFEPCVESCFLPDSYGYRPNKSALEAIGITRQRCWQYDWILEKRNAQLPPDTFHVDEAQLDLWSSWFQPPTPDELDDSEHGK